MNEEQAMSGLQATITSACPHPEAIGKRWGDAISQERQAELQGYMDRWAQETDHGEQKGPFDFVPFGDEEWEHQILTGADVYWLAIQSGLNVKDGHGWVPNLHLERANLMDAHLEGATLNSAHLENIGLAGAYLEGANLLGAHLGKACMTDAHLEGAKLGSDLRGVEFMGAHLQGAYLFGADLEGADLSGADLSGANLRRASFDEKTVLEDTRFGPGQGTVSDWIDRLRLRNHNAALGDIAWHDVDLTVVPWEQMLRLGDERYTRNPRDTFGTLKTWDGWTKGYADAARANRQLATILRSQGLSEDADRFAYRAQICQRSVHLRRFQLGRWLFSWLLFIIAGYGYRPLRTLFWYLAIIFGYAFLYIHFGHVGSHPFAFDEALVFSVTSFHGRGFFPGTLDLKDIVTKLAASEAVLGLFIEVSFIATFTQRYFGK